MDSKTITPYEKMKAHPPQLIVGPHLSLKSQKHFALFAGENLSAGQAISEYTGILEELKPNTNFYNLVSGSEQGYSYGISADYERSLNAEHFGNLLRFANDGWPNSVIIAVSGVKGMSVRPVLFAGEDIQQNREICWDYGPMHDLKWGRYCLMYRREMREFFKKGLLEAYIEFAHKGSDIEDRKQDATIAEIAALECLKGKFTYLLNTPAALIDLVISDIISPNDYILFSTQLPKMKEAILDKTHQDWMLQLVSVLNDLQTALVKKDKLVAKVIKLSILPSLDKLTVVQVIKEMDVISKNFKARNATEAKSELAALEESLQNYKFLDDPDFPLSVELVTKEKVKDEKKNF